MSLQNAIDYVGPHFEQFARNGRWGTCADCPRDSKGNIYPEFCENTDRYDHHLGLKGLATRWERVLTVEENDEDFYDSP